MSPSRPLLHDEGMNTTTVTATSQHAASRPDVSPGRRRLGDRGLFAVAAGIGAVAGLAVGTGVGAIFYVPATDCSASSAWCDTGSLIFGALICVATAIAVYIAAGVAVVRRFRPKGERAAHIAAHTGLLVALGSVVPMVASVVGWLF